MAPAMVAAFIASPAPVVTGPQRAAGACTARRGAHMTGGSGRRPRAKAGSTRVAAAAAAVAASAVLLVQPGLDAAARAAVIQEPQCIEGEGPGCADKEENALVKQLLEKTRANKEKNANELRDQYWQRGYGDYFSFGYDKKLVKGADGTWSLEDPDDPILRAARRVNKIVKEKQEEKEAARASSSSSTSSSPQ